jgi:YfiH family protein
MIYFKANFNVSIKKVNTLITTKMNGYSLMPYDSFNLATHVGDNIDNVNKNRDILNKFVNKDIIWLNQTHSSNVLDLINDKDMNNLKLENDAILINSNNYVGSILTADCKVLLITNVTGDFVMAIHAGWKGVINGIIYNSIQKLIDHKYNLNNLYVYFGPSICQKHFEIKDDVRQEFIDMNSNNEKYIIANNKSYNCDLDAIIIEQLLSFGLNKNNFSFSNLCTFCRSDLFFSFRRYGVTGRIASLIWLSK